MAYEQTDINNIVNGTVNRFTGQTIAMPNGSYPGECTAPVVWYLQNMGAPVPSMFNDRADGWGVEFPAALAPWFTHEAYQAGKAYPKGTLLLWNSPHIAVVISSDGSNNVEVFEQNADPNGSPCGTKTRVVNNAYHACTYALIPVVEVPAPAPPTPTPPAVYTPPAGAATVPSGKTQTLDYDLRGYNTATQAGNFDQSGFKQTVPAGTYPVYNTYTSRPDLVNVKSPDGNIWAWVNLQEINIIKEEKASEAQAQQAADAAAEKAKADAAAATAAQVAKDAADKEAALNASWTTTRPATTQVVVPTAQDTVASIITSYKAWDKPRNYYFQHAYTIEDQTGNHPALPMKEDYNLKVGFAGEFQKDGRNYYRLYEPGNTTDNMLTSNMYGVEVAITEGDKDGSPYLELASVYDAKLDKEDRDSVVKSNKAKYKNTGFDSKEELYAIWTHIEHLTKNNKFFDIIFVPFRKRK